MSADPRVPARPEATMFKRVVIGDPLRCGYCGELAREFYSFNPNAEPDICPACLAEIAKPAALSPASDVRLDEPSDFEALLEHHRATEQSLEAAEAARAALRQQLEQLIQRWREKARVVRPLESARLTAEKRERIREWMFYTNRANELEALLATPAPEPQEKYACLRCSEAAGVANDPVKAITHPLGQRCPADPQESKIILPAIPGHRHTIDANGNLTCGCRFEKESNK
jgi:hypothetical protein